RNDDTFIDLTARPLEANDIKADLFVSVHYNAMGVNGSTARGIESYIYHRVDSGFGQEINRDKFRTDDSRIYESLSIADLVHNQLISGTGMKDRGVKGNNFNVLRNTQIPAILTELGFLDNAADRALVQTDSYQRKAAESIAKGIDLYF